MHEVVHLTRKTLVTQTQRGCSRIRALGGKLIARYRETPLKVGPH